MSAQLFNEILEKNQLIKGRLNYNKKDLEKLYRALEKDKEGLKKKQESNLYERYEKDCAFALVDVAQLGVLDVVETHEGDCFSQILVEARVRHAVNHLHLRSRCYQCHQARLELLLTMLLAL